MTLLRQAPYPPHAAQHGRLAERRGAERLPDLPHIQNLVWAGSQPRRPRAESVANDPAARELDALVQPLLVDDQPPPAEAFPTATAYTLGPEARPEFQHPLTWSYSLTADNR